MACYWHGVFIRSDDICLELGRLWAGGNSAGRLKSKTASIKQSGRRSCAEMLFLFKGMERNRSGERPTSRADPGAASPLPSAMRPAAVCCDSQRPAGPCHLASLRIPRTHIGNPNYATSPSLSLSLSPFSPGAPRSLCASTSSLLECWLKWKGSALRVIPVCPFPLLIPLWWDPVGAL